MMVAARAAAESHVEVMKACTPGVRESYLVSKLRAYGLEHYNTSFRPYGDIMASGKNAATLHYVDNSKFIQENEIVLCDCGHTVS